MIVAVCATLHLVEKGVWAQRARALVVDSIMDVNESRFELGSRSLEVEEILSGWSTLMLLSSGLGDPKRGYSRCSYFTDQDYNTALVNGSLF